MKTSKPFSTISWNSFDYLKNKLDALIERDIFSFYTFIKHYPEDDQEKEHFHILIIPNGQYQTDQLKPYLNEIDPTNIKPLSILPCTSSKFGDWYLYNLHDIAYLASKGQVRNIHYSHEDFITSSAEYLREEVGKIDFSKYKRSKELYDMIKQGATIDELLERGQVPIPQFNAFKAFYDTVKYGEQTVFRNNRTNPVPKHNLTLSDNDPFS